MLPEEEIDFIFMHAYSKFKARAQIMARKIPHFCQICVSVTGLIPVSVMHLSMLSPKGEGPRAFDLCHLPHPREFD